MASHRRAEVNLSRSSRFHAELARRIVRLVCERDCPAGFQLKEQWLADRLALSRTPIRAALRLLTEHGVVRTVANQGCFLVSPASELCGAEWDIPPTAEEKLYSRIAGDRYAKSLPEQINVTEFTRRYRASRSQVQRVLEQFAEEGVVERDQGRGWRFAPALDNPEVYEESYQFRLMVEPMAILDPCFAPDRTRFAELRKIHVELIERLTDSAPTRQVVAVDAQFHETIGAWSGNRFILQAIQQQNQLRRLMEFQLGVDDRERLAQSCNEHLEILKALEAGDRERAAALMREHISVSRDIIPDHARR